MKVKMIASPPVLTTTKARMARMKAIAVVMIAANWGDFPNGVDMSRAQLASENLQKYDEWRGMFVIIPNQHTLLLNLSQWAIQHWHV